MRIYTRSGDLAFKVFNFSDGQPHFKLETYEREFNQVTIETAIRSTHDLFTLLLAVSVLRANGYTDLRLDIRYLLGARMDRAISWAEPFTLSVVAGLINSCGFSKVRVLDAHSEVATRLIRNSENLLPFKVVQQVLTSLGHPTIVIPDKGAVERVEKVAGFSDYTSFVRCGKTRNVATGALTGFEMLDYRDLNLNNLLIIDDICDGGGTFIGLAKVLREAGAKSVNLFVTHGIFSKNLPLEGIDKVFTTDSYYQPPVEGGYDPRWEYFKFLTVIPISMKDLK